MATNVHFEDLVELFYEIWKPELQKIYAQLPGTWADVDDMWQNLKGEFIHVNFNFFANILMKHQLFHRRTYYNAKIFGKLMVILCSGNPTIFEDNYDEHGNPYYSKSVLHGTDFPENIRQEMINFINNQVHDLDKMNDSRKRDFKIFRHVFCKDACGKLKSWSQYKGCKHPGINILKDDSPPTVVSRKRSASAYKSKKEEKPSEDSGLSGPKRERSLVDELLED